MKKGGKKGKKNLVIVESPAKARTIEKFLGKDFLVKSCAGHVRDLPKSRLGVDVDQNFEPSYVVIRKKQPIVKELVSAAKSAEKIYLAPDPDREGEAIAWHLLKVLEKAKGEIKRIEFNEITRSAVQAAVHDPRDIDENRVNAQQARRVLDRLVGYSLSPLLWKKVRRGLSAGRVQSVAVRLVCDREAEIEAFKPEEYWTILTSLAQQEKPVPFSAKLYGKEGEKLSIPNQAVSDAIVAELKTQSFVVKSVQKKSQQRHPSPPFITSTLQQEASRKLRFSARKTMMIAQQLYEGISITGEGEVGLISYMRTDSVRLSEEALSQAKEYIGKTFGAKYALPSPRRFKTKKQAQDAHEAIRPTSVYHEPSQIRKDLSSDQYKLYRLIWERFVATQMASAQFDLTTVEIAAGTYQLRATGRVMRFDGFMVLYLEGQDDDTPKEEWEDGMLPPLNEKDVLSLLAVKPEQHFTEPPPRFSEATLVKLLEKLGIGRPSTYAPIVATIRERGYVVLEERKLLPTELGTIVNGVLSEHFPTIVDTQFTASMEDDLDGILEGDVDWRKMLGAFYTPFAETLKKAEKNIEKIDMVKPSDETCERCGKPMVIRPGRFGEFLACSGFPDCNFTKNVPKPGDEWIEKEAENEVCDKCKSQMVVKHGRYGPFLACSAHPKCRNVKSIQKKLGVSCPKCKEGDLIERRSRRGRIFYGCARYPKCDFASWDKPIPTPCPKCGGLLTEKWMKGKKCFHRCTNESCGHQEEVVP